MEQTRSSRSDNLDILKKNPYDLGWVVGIFEGEGCIFMKDTFRAEVQIVMTDQDVMTKLHHLVGLGTLNPLTLQANRKQAWSWRICARDDAGRFIEMIYPHLGERRRIKAEEALTAWRSRPTRGTETHCKNNHPFSGENLFVHEGRRRCKACRNERARKYRGKLKDQLQLQ